MVYSLIMPCKFFLLKIIPVVFILFAFPLHGKKLFKTPYVSFYIGEDWICKSFGVDWVCHHYLHKGAKPALILITAKEGSSLDKQDFYMQVFNQNQTGFLKKNYVRRIMVHRQTWVESFYQGNFLKDIFSRYVGTVCCDKTKEKVHIFIGFHAYEENYTKYANQFLMAIKSLRLSGKLKETIAQIRRQTDQQREDMLSYIEKILFEVDSEEETALQRNRTNLKLLVSLIIFGFILVGSAGLFYFLYYRKRKRKRKRRVRSRERKKRRKKRV